MVLFLTVPSTVGLALLGVPIIRLIFEHGRFSPDATIETARALSGYAVGLVAYAAIKVVAPAFYALGRTRVPVIASITAVAANLIWNVATFRRFGHVGLALGTSLAALVNFAVLAFAFQRQFGGLLTRELLVPLARIAAASAVMAAAVWALSRWLETLPRRGHRDVRGQGADPDRRRHRRLLRRRARVRPRRRRAACVAASAAGPTGQPSTVERVAASVRAACGRAGRGSTASASRSGSWRRGSCRRRRTPPPARRTC